MRFRYQAPIECRTCGQELRRETVRDGVVWTEGKIVFTYLEHEKNDDCPHSEKRYVEPTVELTEL